MTCGEYLKALIFQNVIRMLMPHRLLFGVFDDMYLGKSEKEILINIDTFRGFIRDLIN